MTVTCAHCGFPVHVDDERPCTCGSMRRDYQKTVAVVQRQRADIRTKAKHRGPDGRVARTVSRWRELIRDRGRIEDVTQVVDSDAERYLKTWEHTASGEKHEKTSSLDDQSIHGPESKRWQRRVW